jgi:hypothetical protein
VTSAAEKRAVRSEAEGQAVTPEEEEEGQAVTSAAEGQAVTPEEEEEGQAVTSAAEGQAVTPEEEEELAVTSEAEAECQAVRNTTTMTTPADVEDASWGVAGWAMYSLPLVTVGVAVLLCAHCMQGQDKKAADAEDPDKLPKGFPAFPEASKSILRKPSTKFTVNETVVMPKPGDPEPQPPTANVYIEREESSTAIESSLDSESAIELNNTSVLAVELYAHALH